MEIVHRNCNLCEAHCGIVLQVDRAKQTVLGIRGDKEDPQSRGYICPKAFGLKGLQEDPDRVRRPLRRTNGDFEEIGWDEALDLLTGRLREIRDAHGPNAIATYLGNPNAHDFGSILAGPIFQRSLGTRWRFSATSVDQLPKMLSSALLFGKPAALGLKPRVERPPRPPTCSKRMLPPGLITGPKPCSPRSGVTYWSRVPGPFPAGPSWTYL